MTELSSKATVARQTKAMKSAVGSDMLDSSQLSAIFNMFPGAKELALKNPELTQALLGTIGEMAGPMIPQRSSAATPGNGGGGTLQW